MAINFPTTMDDNASLYLVTDGVHYPLAAHHNNLKDAVIALETKVGLDSSTVETSVDYHIHHELKLTADAGDKIPFKIKAHAAQAVDLMQIMDSTEAIKIRVTKDYRLGIRVASPGVPLEILGETSLKTVVSNPAIYARAAYLSDNNPTANNDAVLAVEIFPDAAATGDKVAGYFGAVLPSGSAATVYGLNPLVRLALGSTGTGNALEADVDNLQVGTKGVGILVSGTGHRQYGIYVTTLTDEWDAAVIAGGVAAGGYGILTEPPASTAGVTLSDAPELVMRGRYWSGGADNVIDAHIGHDVTAVAPTSLIYFNIGLARIADFLSNTSAMFYGPLQNLGLFYPGTGAAFQTSHSLSGNANGIGIDGAAAASAVLDLNSTVGSLLIPRMTTVQKNALTAVNGMIVYDSTLNKFQGYEGGAWTSFI